MFGKKVVLLEKHYVVGGLNSFYARQGKKFDVGLHALTNYPCPISGKKSPLLKLLRQLRISLDDLDLLPQSRSRITFGDCSLSFNNEFEYFYNQVAEKFPSSIHAFSSLLQKMEDFPAYQVDARIFPPEPFSQNPKSIPCWQKCFSAQPATMAPPYPMILISPPL